MQWPRNDKGAAMVTWDRENFELLKDAVKVAKSMGLDNFLLALPGHEDDPLPLLVRYAEYLIEYLSQHGPRTV